MSDPESELNRMRTAAWLELKDSPMKQKEISTLVGVSQSSVSRAIGISEGRRDGPYTDEMNEAVDRYIIVRDEQKAEIQRIQQAAAERAAAAKARRTQPPRQTTSPPVRRKVSPPQQPHSPPVGPTRQVSSHSTKTIDVGKVVLASGVVLAVLMLVVGVVILASNDTVRELWSVVNDRSPYWGPILGLLSSLYMRLPVGKDEPAAGTLWTMKILMFPTFVVSVLIVFSWLYNLNGMDLVSGL